MYAEDPHNRKVNVSPSHTITYHQTTCIYRALCICALKRGELVVASGQGIVPVAVEGDSHRSPHLVSALVSEQIIRTINLGDISRIKA